MKSTLLFVCLLSAVAPSSLRSLELIPGPVPRTVESPPRAATATTAAATDAAPPKASKADGKDLYGVSCVNCHGATGKGDGIAAGSLKPRPRPFKESLKGMSDAQILSIIAGGKGQMPGWSDVLTEDQQKAILEYIKGLARS